jgi:hypothetical protein
MCKCFVVGFIRNRRIHASVHVHVHATWINKQETQEASHGRQKSRHEKTVGSPGFSQE